MDEEDLIRFVEIENPPVVRNGGNSQDAGNGDADGQKADDGAWDHYSAIYCPNYNRVQEAPKRQSKHQYTNVELADVVEQIKHAFEQFQLKRSLLFARISNELTVMEAKLTRSEEKFSRVAFSLLNQRQAIQRQRQVIAARATEARRAQEMLDRFCCGVCFDREKDTAFNCGHMFCYDCAKNLETSPQSCCPMCRDKIKAVMIVDY